MFQEQLGRIYISLSNIKFLVTNVYFYPTCNLQLRLQRLLSLEARGEIASLSADRLDNRVDLLEQPHATLIAS